MSELETAGEFAKRLADECDIGIKYEPFWDPAAAAPLIAARDNAVRLAAFDEFEELMLLRHRDYDVSTSVRYALLTLRKKYGPK